MINFPTCKINLGLHVLFKRQDGFHEVETGMLEIPFKEILEITEHEQDEFIQTGLEVAGNGNLVLDALQEFRRHYPVPPVRIQLHKLIPMGGGLGGGSSDAAFTLTMLRSLFHPGIPDAELEEMASKLGSDCAFFVRGKAQIGKGRGEILETIDLDLKGYWLVLVNGGIHVPTREAYFRVHPNRERESLRTILSSPLETWKETLVNDFEQSVFALHPELAEMKQQLYEAGALYAAMTGSGSTLFGIFKEPLQERLFPGIPLEKWVAFT